MLHDGSSRTLQKTVNDFFYQCINTIKTIPTSENMFIERDAKVILIFRSVTGIAFFVAFYIIMLYLQSTHPNSNFFIIQLMIFSIITVLTLILIGSLISLKREITRQNDHLQNLPAQPIREKEVRVPYNKSGLYSIIIVAVLGIIGFLYLSTVFVLGLQEHRNMNLGTLAIMIFIILAALIAILLISVFILVRKIHTPLYYNFKSCPKCGSDDIYKVEYSWWGGITSSLVHQVRCKKCGTTYDGVAGTDITKRVTIIFTVLLIFSIIITVLRFIF
jgi:hypothetical protein